MITRCSLPVRAAAFIIALAALFLAPTTGSAQAIDCGRCDHFTFAVSGSLNCSVTICYVPAPIGDPLCQSVAPGGSVSIPCSVSRVWVNTCSGQYSLIPANAVGTCSPVLKFAAGCCGRICNVPSQDACSRIEAQPAPCDTPGCP
ncbi:MAG TPA: hypothetical protein VHI13_12630 [Candidatus Kapabacteria bacterium]|nr:hypothetical protein [Candidatus Kapabacteria bacterium]